MDDFLLYRYYVAMKAHFTSEAYNIIKSQGRTKVSIQSYQNNRQVNSSIKRLAKKMTIEQAMDFMIANFVAGDEYGGIFNPDAQDVVKAWKARMESISYHFENDLHTMEQECGSIEEALTSLAPSHPAALKLLYQNKICIETLVLLSGLTNFRQPLDTELKSDILWRKTSLILRKYKPFVKYNKSRIEEIYGRYRRPEQTDSQPRSVGCTP